MSSIVAAARQAGRDARAGDDSEPRSIGETVRGLLRQAKAGAAAARATVDPDGARARFLESVRALDAILAEDLPAMTAAIQGEVVRKAVRRKVTARLRVRSDAILQLAEASGLSLVAAAVVMTEEGIAGDAARRFARVSA